jgi:hypothetical protein
VQTGPNFTITPAREPVCHSSLLDTHRGITMPLADLTQDTVEKPLLSKFHLVDSIDFFYSGKSAGRGWVFYLKSKWI